MISIEEKDKRFRIAESGQPGAGRGLFATVDIKKGDYLEVIGVEVDRGSIADVCTSFADNYKFASDYADSFNKHIIPMGYGGIVNHANDASDQNVEIKYLRKGPKSICVYSFLRDVRKGEEILGDYGEDYRNSLQNEEDKDWGTFLDLGLYNLGKLKR